MRLAGGEGCHNYAMAEHMLNYAGIGYIQIDAGRIGGISVAKRVVDAAHARGVTYVNHTFTSHLALSASLQPYAGSDADLLCEYPVETSPLAQSITRERIMPDQDGMIRIPERPGLGVTPNLAALAPYLVDVEIRVGRQVVYRTPELR